MADRESKSAVLLRVAKMLSSATDVDDLLYHILERSREVMSSEICSVLLPANEAGDLRIRSTYEHPAVDTFLIPAGKGISGEVFRTKRPLHIRDAREDARFYREVSEVSGLVVRAILTVPLLDGERCLGVLQVLNPLHGGAYSEEDEEIFETFSSLCAVTLMRLEAHELALREVQQREQMGLAREIQRSFLPAAAMDLEGLQMRTFYEPASEVGGDFYFWRDLGEGLFLCGIGDVTGKGLAAALDMARGATLITSLAHGARDIPLGEWVGRVNHGLCDVMTAGRFIAVSALLVDRRRRRAQVCVAGMPAPWVCFGGAWKAVEAPGNPPMGVSCAVRYQDAEFPLVAGRHWLLFSDGILEEANERGEFFEDSAFGQTLRRAGTLRFAEEVCALVSREWREFGGREPNYRDDATMMVVTDEAPALPTAFAFTCCPETIHRGRKFVEDWARHCGFGEREAGLVVMGCDEVMNNVVRHAFDCAEGQLGGRGPVMCRVEAGPEALVVRIEHHGKGITEEEFARLVREPDPEGRVGGMGLFVVREVFDEVRCHPGDRETGEAAWIELKKRWRS